MVAHSSILAWRIPRTEEPGGLQSMGSQRVRHNRSDLARTHVSILLPHDNFTINLGAASNTHYYLIVTVVRNTGIAYTDPLTQHLVKLPSWCQLGLQSHLSPARGRNCFQAHMVVGGIQLLAGCQRKGFGFLPIIIKQRASSTSCHMVTSFPKTSERKSIS